MSQRVCLLLLPGSCTTGSSFLELWGKCWLKTETHNRAYRGVILPLAKCISASSPSIPRYVKSNYNYSSQRCSPPFLPALSNYSVVAAGNGNVPGRGTVAPQCRMTRQRPDCAEVDLLLWPVLPLSGHTSMQARAPVGVCRGPLNIHIISSADEPLRPPPSPRLLSGSLITQISLLLRTWPLCTLCQGKQGPSQQI